MLTRWTERYAQRTQRMGSSAIRDLLKLTEQPEIISFGGGLPAPASFPVDEIAAATGRVLKEFGAQALQYSTTEGYRPLREMIARHTSRYGLRVSADHILITSGSQQALDLLGKVFINPGEHILTEAPTYLGALQAWNSYGAEYVTVRIDEDGMDMYALEAALRTGPKFIYVMPNFQNPSGVTLSLPRRRRLVELADRYGVPVVEDDPYGQLRYEGDHLPPIALLDGVRASSEAWGEPGNVIYLSTFSKILSPGLRLGWVIAPDGVIQKLVQAKQGADLHTPTLNQMVAHEVARDGFLDRHVRTIRALYKERRDLMLAAMEEHFPAEVSWTRPTGGLFLWVTLPEHLRAVKVLEAAIAEKVAFFPGASFFPDRSGHNTMRLNFSMASPEQIQQGIGRLGRVLRAAIATGRGEGEPGSAGAVPVAV